MWDGTGCGTLDIGMSLDALAGTWEDEATATPEAAALDAEAPPVPRCRRVRRMAQARAERVY
jgi:hypothetical protein